MPPPFALLRRLGQFSNRQSKPQRLKPGFFDDFVARLKSCPSQSRVLPKTVGFFPKTAPTSSNFEREGHGFQPCRTRLEVSGFQPLRCAVRPTRAISPPGTYFVTFSTWQRRSLFLVEPYGRLFLKTLYGYKRQGRFELHAFVVMPEHVHLLFTPAIDITLERAMQFIKGGYSHAAGVETGRKAEIWQRGFTDHRIRNTEDFENHRNYIHQNPVERRLVMTAPEYRYCSAFPGLKLDRWPPAAEAA